MRARRHACRAQQRCSANTAPLSLVRQDVPLRRDGTRAFGALKCPFGINAMVPARQRTGSTLVPVFLPRQRTVSTLVPLFLPPASAPLLQSRVVRCQPCAPLSTLARSAQRRCHRQQWHASDHKRSERSSRAAALPPPAAAHTHNMQGRSGGAAATGRITQIARYLLHVPRRNAARRMRHDVYVRVGRSRLRGACGAARCCASHVVPSALTSSALCAIGRANNESKSARDSE